MDYLLSFLLAIIIFMGIFFIFGRKKRNVNYIAKYYNNSFSFKDSILYIKKIASLHKVIKSGKSINWTYKTAKSKWKQLRRDYNRLYNLKGKYDDLVPSARWITDNYYQINQRIKTTKKAFNKHNCKVLPAISDNNEGIYPRSYVVAKEIMVTLGNHYSKEHMLALVESYQDINALKISELWALPVMFNLCVLEDITLIIKQINQSIKEKIRADEYVENFVVSNLEKEEVFELILKDIDNIQSDNEYSFLSQIIYKLQERGIANNSQLELLVQEYPCEEVTYNDVVKRESKNQAILEADISNLIVSLIKINEVDWEEIVGELSVIDYILSKEKCNVYKNMAFKTKEKYRYEIETLALRSKKDEKKIANMILEKTKNKSGKSSHVGYYLIGKGKDELIDKLKISNTFFQKVKESFIRNKNKVYFIILFMLIFVIAISAAIYTYFDTKILGLSILAFILFLVPAFTFLTDIINRLVLNLVRVKNPPSMNFEDGIPKQFETAIVVPIIINSIDQIKKYIFKLEQIYLTNKSENLFFVLLSDFTDCDTAIHENDTKILDYAKTQLLELNKKYFSETNYSFYMFSRHRKFNKKENTYMGWERKRGKLEEFNGYVLGKRTTSFYSVFGNIEELNTIKYVITIDSDTKLIRNNVNNLVGIMAHPLNKAIINEKTNKVVEGYGLIQPRISVGLKHSDKTLFSKVLAHNNGFDPYTTFVSDIYQDVFHEGIFNGKGIYDLEIVDKVLNDRLPENSVLSHDLLEGSYLKCGFASDIQLFDGFPQNILSFSKRQHRWIRGDWQLIPWIFGRDKLPFLSRWQMVSNLLRSISPIAFLLLLLLLSFLFNYNIPILLGSALFIIVIPVLSNINKSNFINISNIGIKSTIRSFSKKLFQNISRNIIAIFSIPYNSYVSIDAITRTLFRLVFSKRKMLEWQTQENVDKKIQNNLSEYLIKMLPTILFSILLIIISALINNIVMIAIGVLWLFAPLTMYIAGKDKKEKPRNISNEDKKMLDKIARDEYRYFEEYFKEQYNYLIPDNVQTTKNEIVAKRTSPTNIGLQLMAFQSARDLGFISLDELVSKIEKTINSIMKLDKWHGHLYNWYNIEDLSCLAPKYISTVDSGNLVGFYITLMESLKEVLNKPILDEKNINEIKKIIQRSGYDKKIEFETLDQLIEILLYVLEEYKNERNPWINLEYKNTATINLIGFINDIQNYENTQESINELCKKNNPLAKVFKQRVLSVLSNLEQLIDKTNFTKVYDKSKNLFYIGYNAEANSFGDAHYDFIASEARLASYIAIAKGDVKFKHWYHLSRPMTLVKGWPTFLSWGGTMFEYFMPHLILKVFDNTVFDNTLNNVLKEQISFGKKNKIPYGISESAYYRFDKQLNYQYRAFGVPSLGLRPDLYKFLVVSPYSSFISMSYNFKKFINNIKKLNDVNASDKCGFYDAIDYMFSEGKEYKKPNVIKTYMCHHKGMSLVSLNNYFNGDIMKNRFHNNPVMKSAEILLEEVKELGVIVKDRPKRLISNELIDVDANQQIPRVIGKGKYKYPILHVLSNDNFQCVLSSTGSGFNKYNDVMVNNWSSDPTDDNYGTFIYVKDIISGKYFSITYAPTFIKPEFYEVVFSIDKVEYRRVEGKLDCKMEVTISPEYNAEIRRATITNLNSKKIVKLEVVSFVEIVLDKYRDLKAHPAFRKLFIETEFDRNTRTVIAARRSKTPSEKRILHGTTCLVESDSNKMFLHETNRLIFIGRGRTLRNPAGVENTFNSLGGSGEVVDPCVSIKVPIEIQPNQSITVSYISAVSHDKQELLNIMRRLRSTYAVKDVFNKALFDSKVEMQYLSLNYEKINKIQDLVTSILYNVKDVNNNKSELNILRQENLWKFSISGDYPIFLVKIKDVSEIETVRDAVIVVEYLRKNQINIDLVIINEKQVGYNTDLSNYIYDIISNVKVFESSAEQTNIYLINKDDLTNEEIILFDTIAKVELSGNDRLLGEKYSYNNLNSILKDDKDISLEKDIKYDNEPLEPLKLDLFNGIGGFNKKTSEYVIELKNWQMTPLPWINVIANEKFGCICTEAGLGYTFNINSRENKITNWSNDPILNPLPEIIYFKDKDTNKIFTTMTTPIRENDHFRIIHGYGYTKYQRNSHGLSQEIKVHVHTKLRFKYVVVSLRNTTDHKRNINSYYYNDLVLGVNKEESSQFVVTDYDNDNNLLEAKNTYSNCFNNETAYLYSQLKIESYTCDKNDFIEGGQNFLVPKSLKRDKLSKLSGPNLNPCFAIQNEIELKPYESIEYVYILGQESNKEDIISNIKTYGSFKEEKKEFIKLNEFWNKEIKQIQVKTPDMKFNYLVNGWFLYQTMSCRLFARTAFYQSGGAFGFRDQLQDSISFLNHNPDITKTVIRKATKHQFIEGDVMHWWHEHLNSGVRTKISDDLLWLPYAVAKYIKITNDYEILDIEEPYIEWDQLGPDEHERYGVPNISSLSESIYEHCKKAITRSLKVGQHNLPLMGTGDWNDGMNMIGPKGKGESVWLAFFLYDVISKFKVLATYKNDEKFIDVIDATKKRIELAIKNDAWDGEWFLRAYFDDGSKLGSKDNLECKIDAISQSWSVISNATTLDKGAKAMDSVLRYLVDENEKMLLLLYPPFHRNKPNPGYIQGYLRGIRENGGQYTHGAIWTVIALAMLKDNDNAYRIYEYLNPLSHTNDISNLNKYKLEPYVMAADVYYNKVQKGRGGWSFYTGSAGWMYQVGLEWILGFKKQGDKLHIEPCIKTDWEEFSIEYNYKNTTYNISVKKHENNNSKDKIIFVDGVKIEDNCIDLVDDKKTHEVLVTICR